jgi:hypothetical protein
MTKVEPAKRMNKADFTKWFKAEFWTINGRMALPTQEELDQLARESYENLVI